MLAPNLGAGLCGTGKKSGSAGAKGEAGGIVSPYCFILNGLKAAYYGSSVHIATGTSLK